MKRIKNIINKNIIPVVLLFFSSWFSVLLYINLNLNYKVNNVDIILLLLSASPIFILLIRRFKIGNTEIDIDNINTDDTEKTLEQILEEFNKNK
jgi:hypothetical protein